MLNRHQQYGQQGEQIAVTFLKKKGYKILLQNYRTPLGEIDIVARQGKSIVFVEVKARKTDRFGSPKESITRDKQIKLTRAALYYLKETGQSDASARFDLVVITGENNTPKLIKNAFDAILSM
jgi:putative endonuclease